LCLVHACTHNFFFLVLAGTIGVISPSGHEVGPFLPIEQAALSHVVSPNFRTEVFAWYTLVGSLATAVGAFCGGAVTHLLQKSLVTPFNSYRVVVVAYAALGALLTLLFLRLTAAAEVHQPQEKSVEAANLKTFFPSSIEIVRSFRPRFICRRVRGSKLRRLLVYLRFGVNPGTLGAIFFWANLFAGFSALLASRLASRIDLVQTMVVTHLPSNILLVLVPLMPSLGLAIALLLLRFSISQMDVPTRQSYTMAVVSPRERSAAAGITGVARTTGAAISPLFAGLLFTRPALISVPFFLAGGLKIVYDLWLYRAFAHVRGN
jgi:predicted MFS family arabinose efflux permease